MSFMQRSAYANDPHGVDMPESSPNSDLSQQGLLNSFQSTKSAQSMFASVKTDAGGPTMSFMQRSAYANDPHGVDMPIDAPNADLTNQGLVNVNSFQSTKSAQSMFSSVKTDAGGPTLSKMQRSASWREMPQHCSTVSCRPHSRV